MADTKETKLAFNGKPIEPADAKKKLVEVYGEKRVDEILAGLKSGLYGVASVAGGHLTFTKD